jgi:hypothetical protein
MFMKYEGLVVVAAIKSTVFWDVTLHNLVELTDVLVECTASIFRVSSASTVSRMIYRYSPGMGN